MQHPFITFLMERQLIPAHASRHLSGMRALVREPIGMIAVGHGLLAAHEIDRILDRQRESTDRFGEIAVEMGVLTAEQVETLIKIQEFRTASAICEALSLAGILPCEDAFRYLGAYLAGDAEMLAMLTQPGDAAEA
ncbi:MAG TPA: hypothetical protein PL151_18330 [Phycisphaerae bacterium]|nr:hypothetical protein [Phycisphaerae bacterium]HOJ76304.1 hypothetical protein [Phycisphaerae bacterium]HOM53712.1 hypothetical protein [Phycisphaerae bacterium]HOQ87232.1 hypothetical protein [Phycisphaerae bacterium]HPP29082.1 hypothetical protein [Phycisphaerae bacterium]